MTPLLRSCLEADLPRLLEIERDAFPHSNWRERDFLRYSCTLAAKGDLVIGFLLTRTSVASAGGAHGEREILSLAVHSPYRRRGVAQMLLSHEMQSGDNYFLEVRESNLGARRLYGRLGFTPAGLRPGYYADPVENAVVMVWKR